MIKRGPGRPAGATSSSRLRGAAALMAAALTLVPASLPAQVVTPCGDGPRADSIPEPWEQNTATYAEGNIRLTAIDTVEPAAAAFYLMILTPPLDELGLRRCLLVGQAEGSGFFGMDFARRTAAYQAGRGLGVTVPIRTYDPTTGDGVPAELTLIIDQSSGKVSAASRPR